MNDSLFFATFDPLYVNPAETCTLCLAEAPAFNDEYCIEQNDGKRHYVKGYCCANCGGGLMKKLERREAEEWAEEEAELRAEQLDATDLQREAGNFRQSGSARFICIASS